MGIMNLCICDDEQITADYYSRELYRLFGERRIQAEIHTFSDPAKLMNELGKGNKWDVYFLDIDMGRTNGIELARSIRKTDGSARIIFLSIHEELVFDTFQVNTYRFIPKHMFHARIRECVDALIEDTQIRTPDFFVVESGADILRFPVSNIVYIHSVDKYLEIHMLRSAESAYVRYQMKAAAASLFDKGFIQPHKSFLVNYRFIQRIEGLSLIMDDGEVIPISRYRLEDVKQRYRHLTL